MTALGMEPCKENFRDFYNMIDPISFAAADGDEQTLGSILCANGFLSYECEGGDWDPKAEPWERKNQKLRYPIIRFPRLPYGVCGVSVTLCNDIETKDGQGNTPLHHAAMNNQVVCAKLLLEAGAEVDAVTPGGFTPLHKAAYNAHAEMIACLLEAGADKKAKTNGGNTPLDCATKPMPEGRGMEEGTPGYGVVTALLNAR